MNKKRIVLLVEDNVNILDINRRILEKEGIVVLSAQTLAEARDRIKVALPDVAVLDIMLPDGSGIDFLVELRRKCGAPALFLTAKAEHADIIAGLTAGGNDYITKPYDVDEFRIRVLGFFQLIDSVRKKQNMDAAISVYLSEKELTVALMVCEGMINKEIAKKVNLSESRIKTCLSGIYRKLGISGKGDKRILLKEMLSN